jgi:micrococcal nuclease
MLLSFGCPKPKTPQELYRVTRIIDGDTLGINYHGQQERIRHLRINTPERKRPGFQEATDAITSLIGGRAVRLEFEEPRRLERGFYGRILAYIFVDDTNINVEMVRAGWSRFWTKYGAGKYADEFQRAENEARELKRGMWGSDER